MLNALRLIIAYTIGLAILVFTGIMVTKVLPYMSFERAINFLGTKPDPVLDRSYFMVAFYTHISSSIIAMGGGVVQFFPKLGRALTPSKIGTKGYLGFHRAIGKLYIGSILLLAAPSGLVLAAFANGGLAARVGFSVQCLVWWLTTYAAWWAVMKKDYTQHTEMMWRSYAVTLAAMSLRTESYALYYWFETKPIETYLTVTWLSWVGNLLIAEVLIYFGAAQKLLKEFRAI
jgi:hypothetical protein